MPGVGRVLRVTVRTLWDDLFVIFMISLLWAFISFLPPVIVFALTGSRIPAFLIFIAATSPATAGLYYITNRLANGLVAHTTQFFGAMRRYAMPAWGLGILNGLALVIAIVDIEFYVNLPPPLNLIVSAVWIVVLVFWLFTQFYAFPMIMEQERPNIWHALRNGAIMALSLPVLTLVIFVLLVGVLALAAIFVEVALAFLPVLVIVPAVFALFTNVAVVRRLRLLRGEPEEGAE
ncbi:MAG: hypothetical protein U0822_09500 [Anaerolineae bacterium]